MLDEEVIQYWKEITGLLGRGAEVEEPEQLGEAPNQASHRSCSKNSSNFISFFLKHCSVAKIKSDHAKVLL